MSDRSTLVDVNVRASRYFLARAVALCPACRLQTELLGIGAPPGHEALIADDSALTDEDADDTWDGVPHVALFFHIERVSRAVSERLARLSDSFRLVPDADSGGPTWANHCAHCDFRWDDQDLFCEPGGAFMPTSLESADGVRLLHIDEPFEASVAGCAYPPAFFEAMRPEEA